MFLLCKRKRPPTPVPSIYCPMCPDEDNVRAILMHIDEACECGIYCCKSDPLHVTAYPYYEIPRWVRWDRWCKLFECILIDTLKR